LNYGNVRAKARQVVPRILSALSAAFDGVRQIPCGESHVFSDGRSN
jgi:hypothetical protein